MTPKEIMEKRGELNARLEQILAGARLEQRAVTEEESKEFEKIEEEIRALDRTAELEKRAHRIAGDSVNVDCAAESKPVETRAEKALGGSRSHAAVNDYIRGIETRAGEMTTSENGVISTDFSADIIHSVTELSGIIGRIGVVNSRGDYKQIVADSENKITAAWTPELGEITSSQAKFKTITLKHHKLTSLFKFSKELLNQNQFDIAAEAMNQMSLDFAVKSETAVIKGTGDTNDQPTGLVTAGTSYIFGSHMAITAEDIVKIYHSLKSPYQMNAVWLMSNDTLCNIRLLTDGAGRYIFHQADLTSGYMGTILGKPVLVSEAMDNMGAGKTPILYGDFRRGYKANLNPDVSIEVLREKYAEYACVGVVGIMYIDGKPVNSEAYVTASYPSETSAPEGV